MEWSQVLARRRMVRRYDPGLPVPEDSLEAVLDAAISAPSAGFTQAVSYLVLTGADIEVYWGATVAAGQPPDRWLTGLRTAPVLISVWTDQAAYLDRYALPDKGWTDRDPARWSAPYWWVDAGMGVMAALLTAVDEGLGACFFGVPTERIQAVRAAFQVPMGQESVGTISVGFPAGDARPTLRRARRPRSELIRRGRWQ